VKNTTDLLRALGLSGVLKTRYEDNDDSGDGIAIEKELFLTLEKNYSMLGLWRKLQEILEKALF
jgi:hypothetical protein